MQREVSRVKRARLLSQNQIQEIVMDSDGDEEKYYTSEDMEDKEEPCPPSRWSSISQLPSPDFSTSSSEDEDDVCNVSGQRPQHTTLSTFHGQ
jgi:hypothetical protein